MLESYRDAWKKLNGMLQTTAKLAYIDKVQTLFPQQENGTNARAGPSSSGAVISTLITAEPDSNDTPVSHALSLLAISK